MNTYCVGTHEWVYMFEQEPPKNQKIHMLSKGGISILGTYTDSIGAIAWAPLHKRNKEKEEIQNKLNLSLIL